MKALVVDDDVVSRMALTDLLAGYDIFDLVEAEDGQAAWQLLEQGLRPAICFCDVRMPHMSGIDLLQHMKAHAALAEVPFVLVSSASDRDTVLQAVRLGALGYILKPLHAPDARAHLEKIFSVTLDKMAENPLATMQRLNIGGERLNAYLHAFSQQLASARRELGAAPAGGPDTGARIDALHTGCKTLGLWHMAAVIDALRGGAVLDCARLDEALATLADALARQSRRARATLPAKAAGAGIRPGALV